LEPGLERVPGAFSGLECIFNAENSNSKRGKKNPRQLGGGKKIPSGPSGTEAGKKKTYNGGRRGKGVPWGGGWWGYLIQKAEIFGWVGFFKKAVGTNPRGQSLFKGGKKKSLGGGGPISPQRKKG